MGAVVVFKDITERKQAEEALHRSETKFRTLYDSTSDAVMLLDEKGFFDCNKATLTIFGCATREEFCSKHPADLSPPKQPCGTDSMMLANQRIATAMEKGSIHFEWMHKRNDTGETFPADVLLTAMELDGKPVVQAVVRDITERKRAEEALRNSEGHLRALVSTIPDIIWLKDKDGVYLSCNSMFERFFGAREADIVGKTDYDFVNRELADSFRSHDREAMAVGKPISKEDWITFADDGHRALMEAIKTPMYDARGMLIGVLGIGRDITVRKQAEEKIRQMAYHDSLTGLPNRKLFSDRLGIALVQAQRNQKKAGVAMLDLDNFKEVNDTQGHEGGGSPSPSSGRAAKGSAEEG